MRALSPGVKRQGREADHSPPSSVEVKNGRVVPPLPHTSTWCAAYLIKYRDKFTFYQCVTISVFTQIYNHETSRPSGATLVL
jgi:hypothetical protein